MAQTILLPVRNFDANQSVTFKFEYYGSSFKRNKLTIRDNINNEIVYQKERETMKAEHTVAPQESGLVNGGNYNARICVLGVGQQEYDCTSTPVIFRCFAAPTVAFEGISDGERLLNSSVYLNMRYSQEQGDLLNSYEVKLFDAGGHEIWNGGTQYPAPDEPEFLFHQTLYNLENNYQYAVECLVESVGGLVGSTGRLYFSVAYEYPEQFSLIQTINVPEECAVKVAANVVMIDGRSIPEPGALSYRWDTVVDLTQDGHKVIYDKGVNILDDFELKLKCEDIRWYSVLCEVTNQTDNLIIKAMKGRLHGETEEKCYFVLRAFNSFANFVTISNAFGLEQQSGCFILDARKKNNLYSIQAKFVE